MDIEFGVGGFAPKPILRGPGRKGPKTHKFGRIISRGNGFRKCALSKAALIRSIGRFAPQALLLKLCLSGGGVALTCTFGETVQLNASTVWGIIFMLRKQGHSAQNPVVTVSARGSQGTPL